MKKKIIASLLSLTMVFSMTACGGKNTDSDVDYIKDKGTLVVGITDFEPMDYKDDSGEWVGFDADMAKMVAESLGVDVEFVEIDWDNKIMELKSKNIDVVWNGMTLIDEVKNSMECTNAYCSNGQVIVTTDESKLDDPSKLTFAVEAVAEEEGYNANSVASQADALMEVASGTSDAAIIDLLMASAMIGEGTSYPDLIRSDELTSEEYGVGCRKDSDLAAYINEQLTKAYKDGKTQEIAEKYGIADAVLEQK